ncbi:unnamed protein product [Phytomonas sp. Hart1]|nr:unnamed protein product [Phytomonas sp. Hart1]|eukprot:CCW70681.1 unnamed protein product [Phytomonas sp. isolate Hart1]
MLNITRSVFNFVYISLKIIIIMFILTSHRRCCRVYSRIFHFQWYAFLYNFQCSSLALLYCLFYLLLIYDVDFLFKLSKTLFSTLLSPHFIVNIDHACLHYE